MLHRIKIQWRSDQACDISAKSSYGVNYPRHTVHQVTPMGFEAEDRLYMDLLEQQHKLMWYAKAGPEDDMDVLYHYGSLAETVTSSIT